ncbi:MAG TPA: YetF domain-containing protein [Usitatibacter sp.]|nr:YetF domain-containing protein [Usitatibacter sp.]
MDINWHEIFVPSSSIAEIAIRGTVIYLMLFLTMRFLPRRTIGSMSASDLLIVVLIADAVQNGMSNDYKSVTEGLVLAATIVGWATFIDWLDFRFPHWHIASGKEIPVVDHGKILHEKLDGQFMTEDELLSQLRMHGQASPAHVRNAYLEGDGHISVILESGEALLPPTKRLA